MSYNKKIILKELKKRYHCSINIVMKKVFYSRQEKSFLSAIALVFCLFVMIDSGAQDIHFSQYYNAPLRLNPALTGAFDGKWRAHAAYRTQWSSVFGKYAYKTYAAGFDMKFHAFKDDYFSVGLSLFNDQAGASRFAQRQGHLSFSYLKKVGGGRGWGDETAHYLVLGGEAGFGQNGIYWNDLRFSQQFNGEFYDPNLSNGENTNVSSKTYLDAGAGLMYYGVFADNMSLYAGGSVSHLLGQDISFIDGRRERIYYRYSGYLGGQIPFGEEWSILPSVLFMLQGPSMEINGGGMFRYQNTDWNAVALRAGGYARIANTVRGSIAADAFVISAGAELQNWRVGISYDFNISTLEAATQKRGATELTVMYTQPMKDREGMACPKW